MEWGKRFCIREEARGREERVGWNWREIGRFAWLISYTPFSQVAETLIIPSRLEGDFFPRLSRGLLIVITSRLNYPCSGYCNGKPMIIYNIIYSVLIKFLNTNEAWATPQKLILHSIQSDIRNFQKKISFRSFVIKICQSRYKKKKYELKRRLSTFKFPPNDLIKSLASILTRSSILENNPWIN